MAYIVLYWGAMALGYFTGSRQRHNSGKFRFLRLFPSSFNWE